MAKAGRVEVEHTQYIESPHFAKQRRIHKRLGIENAATIREAEAWRKTFRIDEQPALLIRMNETSEGMPAGVPIQLPRELSTALIRVRASTPVGDFSIEPGFVVTEDEL